jgi:hypothetical protein
MLSAPTSVTIKTAGRRGTHAVLQIGPDRPQPMPISFRHSAIWAAASAPALLQGNHPCYSSPERGRTALISGMCRLLGGRSGQRAMKTTTLVQPHKQGLCGFPFADP